MSFNFLASLINGNVQPILPFPVGVVSFNFLASLINGNGCYLYSLLGTARR